jgi:hypothetical protein
MVIPCDADRQARAQGGGAADGVLVALGEGCAHQAVFDLGWIDPRSLHGGADRVPRQGRGPKVVEGAAIGAADRRARGGDDDGVSGHVGALCSKEGARSGEELASAGYSITPNSSPTG